MTPSVPLNIELTAVERVLSNRGIKPADIKHYLNTTDKDILDPKQIMNITEGVKILIKHIQAGDKIMV